MNLKKLAILLGITALCSFADAKAVVNVNGAQSSGIGVDTSDVQTNNNLRGSSGIGITLDGGSASISSTRNSQTGKTNISGDTKVATSNTSQGATNVNVNLSP